MNLRFRSAARSDAGPVRTSNEDRFLQRPALGLWAVADGMGGHEAGEVASGLIVEALAEVDDVSSGYAYLNAVRATIERVNDELVRRAEIRDSSAVIGSTIVALLIHEAHYACLWAGDSRAYRLRGGGIVQLSHDHSMVQELVDAGALTREQARADRRANVITRAVGVRRALDLGQDYGPVEPGDCFLLCSDGLTGLLDDDELSVAMADPDPETAADRLLALALGRGARDNVTLVVIRAAAN